MAEDPQVPQESQESPDPRFLFVKPSVKNGELHAYHGYPKRVFVQSSWEWLYERITRRRIVTVAPGLPLQSVLLASHEGMYRLTRLLARNGSNAREPFLRFDGTMDLPNGSGTEDSPYYSRYTVTRLPSDLPVLVLGFDYDSEFGRREFDFCDPSWEPSFRYADTSVTETGTCEGSVPSLTDPLKLRGRCVLSHSPYDPSAVLPVFPMLYDQRFDSPAGTAYVPVWDREKSSFVGRRMFTCPSRGFSTPDFSEDTGEFERWQGFDVLRHPYYALSDLTKSLALPGVVGKDVSSYSSDDVGNCFDRGGKASPGDVLGLLLKIPEPAAGGHGLASTSGYGFTLCPSADWNGDPTYWHRDFPDISPEPYSSAEREQVEALCAQQPSVPGVSRRWFTDGEDAYDLPQADEEDASAMAEDLGDPAFYLHRVLYASPACAPAGIERLLDRYVRTVCEIPEVYARISCSSVSVRRRRRDYYEKQTVTEGSPSERSDHEGSVTTESYTTGGSFADGFSWWWSLARLGGRGFSVTDLSGRTVSTHTVSPLPSVTAVTEYSDVTVEETEVRFTGYLDGIVPLRSGHSCPSGTKTVHVLKTVDEREGESSSTYESGESVTEGPAAGDLFFHPDVLKWAVRVRLVLVARVKSPASGGYPESPAFGGYTESRTTEWSSSEGSERTGSQSAAQAGTRTSYGRVSVVPLGEMDLATGAFPRVDLSSLFRQLVPPGVKSDLDSDRNYVSRIDSESESGDYTRESETQKTDTELGEAWPAEYLESARLFAVVDWDIDREDPPHAEGDGPYGSLKRLLELSGRLDEVRLLLERFRGVADDAGEVKGAVSSGIARLRELLDDPEEAVPEAILDAEAAVEAAEEALSEAEEVRTGRADALAEVNDRIGEVSDKIVALEAAGEDASEAYGSLDALNGQRTTAESDLKEAEENVLERQDALGAARRELEEMLQERSADRDEAEEAVSGAEEELGSLEAGLEAFSGSVDSLADLVSEASDALSTAREHVGRDDFEEFLDEAERAIDSAEDAADGMKGPSEDLEGDSARTGNVYGDARRTVWRYLGTGG